MPLDVSGRSVLTDDEPGDKPDAPAAGGPSEEGKADEPAPAADKPGAPEPAPAKPAAAKGAQQSVQQSWCQERHRIQIGWCSSVDFPINA